MTPDGAAHHLAGLTYQAATVGLRNLSGDNLRPLRIVVGGNANVEFMVPGLRIQLAAEGIHALVRSTSYSGWVGETFTADGDDVWIVWLSAFGQSRGGTARPDHDTKSIAAAIGRLVEHNIRVVVIAPEPLPAEDDPFSPFGQWRRSLVSALRDDLPVGAIFVTVDHLLWRIGMGAWHAPRYWEQAKAPCHPDAATAVGLEVATVVARSIRPLVKAIAVDLDDTLWGGLVGEVGTAGVALDPDGTGRAHLELQRFLADLAERGVAIGVVSKNEAELALRTFEERPEMILKPDHIVRFEASWEPKYLAISRLARHLNVGIDSVCFIDDSAFERDEAHRMLPGLIVPDLPESPAKRVEYLTRSRLFTAPVVTEDDRLRVSFYRRSPAQPDGDLDAYLEGLQMRLEVRRLRPGDATDRALSLLHKTNQFNINMWRPTPSVFASFIGDDSRQAFTYRVVDRLGDAGVVAVLLAELSGPQARVSAWVMSCRVFGRGVEWAIADHLLAVLDKSGAESLTVPYVAGPRNTLVVEVLRQLGFVGPVASLEALPTGSVTVPRHHLTIEES
jgi:FkbH-like protein